MAINPFSVCCDRDRTIQLQRPVADGGNLYAYPEQDMDGALSLLLRVLADKYSSGFTGATPGDSARYVKTILEGYSKNNVLTNLFAERFANVLRT